MPLISIIVPVYKVEDYLGRCLDSILSQTFSDFELLLIDDGSPDRCPAICDLYAHKDSRVRVFHRDNQGVSAARNFGIEWALFKSDSQWIMFADSDDWLHPMMLDALWKAAIQENVQISMCGYIRTDGSSPEIKPENIQISRWTMEDIFREKNVNAIVPWGKLYKKNLFASVRYPVGMRYEDERTTPLLLLQSPYIAYIDAPMYCYFNNPSSFMNEAWSPTRLDALNAHIDRINIFHKAGHYALYQWSVGVYIWYIIAMREKVITLDDLAVSHKYATILRNRLRTELYKYRKDLPIEKFAGAYETAFPKAMQLYWLGKSAWSKFKN